MDDNHTNKSVTEKMEVIVRVSVSALVSIQNAADLKEFLGLSMEGIMEVYVFKEDHEVRRRWGISAYGPLI